MTLVDTLLSTLASLNALLVSRRVHDLFYPFAYAPTLHAARVSLTYQAIRSARRRSATTRASSSSSSSSSNQPKEKDREPEIRADPLLYDLAGFLVMAWGGSFLSCYVVGVVPPQLLSVWPLVNYASVHLVLTALFSSPAASLLPLPAPWALDAALPLLDGVLRSYAVLAGVRTVLQHGTNHAIPPLPPASSPSSSDSSSSSSPSPPPHYPPPVPSASLAIRHSLPLQLLVATLSATGGGQLALTLDVFRPLDLGGWSLSTPPLLRARSVLETTDVWASVVAATAYSLSTANHAAWDAWLVRIDAFLVSRPAAGGAAPRTSSSSAAPLLSQADAHALVSLVFCLAFAWRGALGYLGQRRGGRRGGEPTRIPAAKEKQSGAAAAAVAAASTTTAVDATAADKAQSARRRRRGAT